MIETITAVNTAVNNFIWGVPAMVCIIGVGLLLSVRTTVEDMETFLALGADRLGTSRAVKILNGEQAKGY